MRSPIVNAARIACLFLLLHGAAKAQLRTDPLVAAAVAAESEALGSELKAQVEQQKKILGANTAILGELEMIRGYEDKMYKYMSEAQGVIKNAHEIYRCTGLVSSIFENFSGCMEELVGHPQQAAISAIVSKQYVNVAMETADLIKQISDLVLKDGDQNLLTSGERQRVLWQITGRLSTINRELCSLRLQIKYLKWSYVPMKLAPKGYWTFKKSEVLLGQIKRDIDRIGR